MKTCSHCKEIKSLNQFHNDSGSKDGKHHYCKLCVKARNLAVKEAKRSKDGIHYMIIWNELRGSFFAFSCNVKRSKKSFKVIETLETFFDTKETKRFEGSRFLEAARFQGDYRFELFNSEYEFTVGFMGLMKNRIRRLERNFSTVNHSLYQSSMHFEQLKERMGEEDE